ncbi:MAG: flagellar basal body-associated FliL family protein [Gammaproteobacteria bacterium]|jgi:flagellar FliL protein|nr:flagellar basal body-associated FliL family protein [Gammaproteobacteria bacterium]
MPDRNEHPDEDGKSKPKVNKLMIGLILFMSLLCVAMIASFYMIMKMQAPASTPQAEVVEASKNVADSAKEHVASKETEKAEAPKAEKVSDSGVKSNKAVLKPQYYKLKPSIVVNIPGVDKSRFLQVDVELMTRNSAGIENVEAYAPLIRNDLITLFSTQKYDDLVTVEGKEELRKKALEIVQKVMKQNTGEPVIEQVLFTNFVSQ